MTVPRNRFFGSIFQHSLFLAVGCALALAFASAAIIFGSRGPFYFPLSTFEIARLVEGRSIGRNDPDIVVAPGRSARRTSQGEDVEYEEILSAAIALNLGLPRERVVFAISRNPRGFDPPIDMARLEYLKVSRSSAAAYADDPRYAPLVFGSFEVSVQRADGSWLTVSRLGAPPGPQWQYAVTKWIGVALVLVFPIAWLFSNRLARPIRKFAAAADRIGHGSFERVDVAGPIEIRTAAAALNEMQARLERQVKERTAVVGAIAHDLRTPLTRLAFLLRDASSPLKEKTEAEIAGMDRLITVALDYVRSETAAPADERVDLRLVVESVVDEFADMGADV
ncbi:MAG: HAMP domain-containing histidine kinase, partial [Parvularculaceae bacterium]|nr:HAMP domain-containing histidine kinase [Parvularculaceae bacterium]